MAREGIGGFWLGFSLGDIGDATVYHSLAGASYPPTSGFTEADARTKLPSPKRIRSLVLITTSAQPAARALIVAGVKNGVRTALLIRIPASAPAGVYRNTAQYVDLDVNDTFSLETSADPADIAESARMTNVAYILEPL